MVVWCACTVRMMFHDIYAGGSAVVVRKTATCATMTIHGVGRMTVDDVWENMP